MGTVWTLILFSAVGALLCARGRAAGPAALFTAVAVVLFILTPAGDIALRVIEDVTNGDTPTAGGAR